MTADGAHTDHDLVLVVDFGAQYAQLIARRVREARVYSEIVPHTMPVAEMLARNPKAIVLSGGPVERLRGGRAEHRPGAVHGRHPGVRHVLRLPADGAGAGRRGRAHRGPRVRPHPGRDRGARDPPGRRTPPAQRLDVARRLGGAGAGGVHRAGLDGGHAGGGLRGRRARAGRRPVAPGGAAHRARPEGARALPARHRRLPPDLDDAQHRRGAGRGDPRADRRRAGRSAHSPVASTPRWPRRSCSARSASG